jgi:N-acetyl-anhydromuramyl-L-alanine amidase AmpD
MSLIDSLPYRHALGDGGPRSRTQVVVVHVTDNTASAEAEASYATRRPDQTSAHFYVDGDSVIRALPLGHIAYGCHPRGNAISVQFEITGHDTTVTDAELRQAAPVIAEVCRIYGIPVRHLSPADVRNGVKGLCGHADITAAFGQGDHTDGGPRFPWQRLLGYVNAALTPPAAAAAPTRKENPDMLMLKLPTDDTVYLSWGPDRGHVTLTAPQEMPAGVPMVVVKDKARLAAIGGPSLDKD